MTVYDIVQIVRPGALTSDKPGRHWIGVRDRRRDAEQFADRCNECATVPGISYHVEAHDDDECPARAFPARDGDSPDISLCRCDGPRPMVKTIHGTFPVAVA
jgi:hypothetical protein